MPSSPKILKEDILQKALDILIREGYSAITIKRIANEMVCSTQPISWQFGGMDGFREALTNVAMDYVNRKIKPTAHNFVEAFEQTGEAYVDLAIDEPYLFRFICMGESGRHVEGGLVSLLSHDRNRIVQQGLCDALHITPEQAESFMNTMVIYTHGIASLIAAGVVREDKAAAHAMVKDTGIRFLIALGLSSDEANSFFCSEN